MPQRPEITSTKNPLVKRIRALAERDAREAEGRMVVEGTRMVEEVLEAGAPVELLLYDPLAVAGPRGEAMLERARRLSVRLFFFQAEDGIRYYKVTGVQTCALPIWPRSGRCSAPAWSRSGWGSCWRS